MRQVLLGLERIVPAMYNSDAVDHEFFTTLERTVPRRLFTYMCRQRGRREWDRMLYAIRSPEELNRSQGTLIAAWQGQSDLWGVLIC